VEEATTDLVPEAKQDDAGTETMEVENAADPERAHPVAAEDTVAVENLAAETPEEAVKEETKGEGDA
jgi:hypothetical protein